MKGNATGKNIIYRDSKDEVILEMVYLGLGSIRVVPIVHSNCVYVFKSHCRSHLLY